MVTPLRTEVAINYILCPLWDCSNQNYSQFKKRKFENRFSPVKLGQDVSCFKTFIPDVEYAFRCFKISTSLASLHKFK